jgi:hypothetical protein
MRDAVLTVFVPVATAWAYRVVGPVVWRDQCNAYSAHQCLRRLDAGSMKRGVVMMLVGLGRVQVFDGVGLFAR